MRRALLVGINDYPKNPLSGCINDALRMREVFRTHENGDPNFTCNKLISSEKEVTQTLLKVQIDKLFNHGEDTALLYFSGHGGNSISGTCIVTQDGKGIDLFEIVTMANKSKANEIIIILDCCYAGGAGNIGINNPKVILREGVSILAAAGGEQYSYEKKGYGVFTSLMYEALKGAAADIRGKVNLSEMYYYSDTLLNAWKQRPVFKSHVSRMISLRDCNPKIPSEILRQLPVYFEGEKTGLQLSPSYLKGQERENKSLLNIMEHLKQYHANGLLVPTENNSLETTARASKNCCLTPQGKYYKQLVKENCI